MKILFTCTKGRGFGKIKLIGTVFTFFEWLSLPYLFQLVFFPFRRLYMPGTTFQASRIKMVNLAYPNQTWHNQPRAIIEKDGKVQKPCQRFCYRCSSYAKIVYRQLHTNFLPNQSLLAFKATNLRYHILSGLSNPYNPKGFYKKNQKSHIILSPELFLI